MFKRILIAIDDSKTDRQAIELGARLVRSGAQRVALVHVVPPMPNLAEAVEALKEAYAAEGKASIADLTHARALLPGTVEVDELVIEGTPAAVVAATADDWRADLVIVGTRGGGRFRSFAVGSVAQAIIRSANCPVLVARQYNDELPPTHARQSIAALNT